ncbi:MAG: S-layer homology domain-containing protein [Oscillospiraceae bacterium]
MKHLLNRGAVLLTALALLLSASPGALAQSPAGEEPALFVSRASVWNPVGEYSEGMIRVTDGTLWGYADVSGTLVIPLQFDAAEDFYLGTALVKKNGMTGVLHWNGTFLLEPKYDELTGLGYGVYLGRRGSVWDLLSITPFSTAEGASQELYSDQASAVLSSGTAVQQLLLRSQDGTATRILISSLSQLLESRKVPGWQFPLSANRQASFRDVSGSDWYDRWVNLAYNVGLMEGTGGGMFEPARALTVAEALRLAACMESRARRDDFHLQSVSGSLWYSSSVAYCEACGVISPGEFGQADFSRPITRAEMARVFSATTPVRSMGYLNSLSRVRSSVPDVKEGDFAADAIYGLYAKGILTGTDSALSFHPGDNLTRAEAAAIASRIARPEQRVPLW